MQGEVAFVLHQKVYSSRGVVGFFAADCSAVAFESQEKSATVLLAGLLGFSCMSFPTFAMLVLSLSPSSAMESFWENSSLPSAMFLAILDRVTVQPMSVASVSSFDQGLFRSVYLKAV